MGCQLGRFSSPEISGQFYIPSSYKASNGRNVRNFLITEKGVAQLIGGYSLAVEKAFELNVAYINKFEEMRRMLDSPLALYENKSRWDLILLHAQAEKEKEILALENNQIKQAVVEIKSSLNNLEADIRVNINQAIRRLADVYCKHNKISGVDRECIYREIYQTIYTGFCKEYSIKFQDIKDREYLSLKTGKPTKTKQSFIKIIESMGYSTMLMEYVIQLKPTEIELIKKI